MFTAILKLSVGVLLICAGLLILLVCLLGCDPHSGFCELLIGGLCWSGIIGFAALFGVGLD